MAPQSVHQFAEKVALVTDGANPVGRAVALQLALQGAYVITAFADLSAENLRAVDELRSLGTLAGAVAANVSRPDGARAAAAEVEKLFGRLDLLVNSLKTAGESSFEETSAAVHEEGRHIAANAVRHMTEAAMHLMRPRPKPKIVNLAWLMPGKSSPELSNAADSAVAELTRSLAAELPSHFRVNCVTVPDREPAEAAVKFEFLRPAGAVSPDDAARVITFLLSSESIALNGQVLSVS